MKDNIKELEVEINRRLVSNKRQGVHASEGELIAFGLLTIARVIRDAAGKINGASEGFVFLGQHHNIKKPS